MADKYFLCPFFGFFSLFFLVGEGGGGGSIFSPFLFGCQEWFTGCNLLKVNATKIFYKGNRK